MCSQTFAHDPQQFFYWPRSWFSAVATATHGGLTMFDSCKAQSETAAYKQTNCN